MKPTSGKKSILIFLFIVLTSCSPIREKIFLSSEKDIRIDSIKVFAADDMVWSGSLEPAEIRKISFTPLKDGHIKVQWSYHTSNQIFEVETGYVTPYSGQKHYLTFQTNDSLIYTYKFH